MKKAVSLLLVAVTFFFSSCEKYDHAIGDLNDRLNHIEGLVISTLGQQIAGINGSLDDLKGVDAALQQLIDDLTDKVDELQKQFDDKQSNDSTTANLKLLEEINNLRSLIEALQAKSVEFEGQIAKLKNYVDSEISDIENWSNGTFATLEQYAAMQTEIAAIKALLEHNNSDIIGECTKAITEAIGTCEATMKKWVNEQLASGYYDIAAIDAKLAALESKLTGADDELKKEIEDQQAALEQAKAELTAAYKQAITEAIDTNNGVINKAIADAVQEALDKVDTRLAVIDNAIAAIQRDIETIKSSIATLEQQIAGINGSLVELEAVDAALQQLIDGLEGEVATLQSQIDSNTAADAATKVQLEKEITDLKNLIATLQAKDADLEAQITALKSYVDSEITGIESWANGTFATLAQYAAMQSELAALKALVGDGNTGNIEEFTRAIAASEASMKGWVNQLLASGYYDIAAIDAKLATLESKLTATETQLRKDIEQQQTALEQAKVELTAAYQQAITEAIDNNNGVITTAIEQAVQTAKADLQNQINAINSAIANLQTQIDKIANRIQSITYIPQYSDGKVKFDYTTKTTEVYLRLSPAALAADIETSMVKAFVRYTDDPTTRALNEEFPVTVNVVAGNATSGILHVCLAEDANHPFADSFWKGDVEAILYLLISDGNSNIVSSSIPVITHSYVSGSSDIDGFGDGQSSEGTVQ